MTALSFEIIGIAVAVALLLGIPTVMLLLAVYNARRKPPIEAEFATNKRLDEVEEKLESKIEALREKIGSDGSQRSKTIFDRFNQFSQAIQDKIEANHSDAQMQIASLREDVAATPLKTIEALKALGVFRSTGDSK
jgi:hypothetical protein